MVPQQWLAHTSVLGVPPTDRRRLDLVVGRDAAMLLDPVGDDVQRGLGARRAGDDVQVVQERQKLLARLKVSRRLLQALVLTEGEQRGGERRRLARSPPPGECRGTSPYHPTSSTLMVPRKTTVTNGKSAGATWRSLARKAALDTVS